MQTTWVRLKKDPQFIHKLRQRQTILSAMRVFFMTRGYLEAEVPQLAPALIPESYLEVFATKLLDRQRNAKTAYLLPSPELWLKKLLVGGVDKCFSIARCFRNTETNSRLHNPEFTLLEWYRTKINYFDLMTETEELFLTIYTELFPKSKNFQLTYQNQTIDLSPPWERLSMRDAFRTYARIDLAKNLTLTTMRKTAKSKGYSISTNTTWEELFNQIYLNEVEPHLGKGKPTFIYDFPVQVGALAQKKKSDLRYAERYELYIAGLELGDAYSELTDWKEQAGRFKRELVERKRLGKIEHPADEDFITALKQGLPTCAGLALGVDRVVMLFTNSQDISETLLFPAAELWPDVINLSAS